MRMVSTLYYFTGISGKGTKGHERAWKGREREAGVRAWLVTARGGEIR